jgi:hypothetical protein
METSKTVVFELGGGKTSQTTKNEGCDVCLAALGSGAFLAGQIAVYLARLQPWK